MEIWLLLLTIALAFASDPKCAELMHITTLGPTSLVRGLEGTTTLTTREELPGGARRIYYAKYKLVTSKDKDGKEFTEYEVTLTTENVSADGKISWSAPERKPNVRHIGITPPAWAIAQARAKERRDEEQALEAKMAKDRKVARAIYLRRHKVTGDNIERARGIVRARVDGDEAQIEDVSENFALVHAPGIYDRVIEGINAIRPLKAEPELVIGHLLGTAKLDMTINMNSDSQAGYEDVVGALQALRANGCRAEADAVAHSILTRLAQAKVLTYTP